MAKKSLPFVSKYELAALLAERAAEIADGKPITVENPGTTDPMEIAKLELRAKKIPKKIHREWPDGSREVWTVSELKTLNYTF